MVFIVNYAMDFILLTITDAFLKNHAGYRRIALAALTGAVWACMVQTGIIANAFARDIFTYVIINSLMAYLCTSGKKGGKGFAGKIAKTALFYIVAASLLGGLAGLIYNNTAAGHVLRAMALESEWLFVCLMAGLVIITVLLKNYMAMRAYNGSICEVEIDFGEFAVSAKGIIDTGNVLFDSIRRKPVHVMDKICADRCAGMDITEYCHRQMLQQDCTLGLHYIMFSSVGRKNGCMPVIMAKSVRIELEGREVIQKNVPIGLSSTPLSQSGVYNVLLNSEIRYVK